MPNTCVAKSEGLVRYPTTLAPVSGSVTVTTQCADNAHGVSSSPSVLCTSSGSWSGAIPQCQCNTGYHSRTVNWGTSSDCPICPTGPECPTLTCPEYSTPACPECEARPNCSSCPDPPSCPCDDSQPCPECPTGQNCSTCPEYYNSTHTRCPSSPDCPNCSTILECSNDSTHPVCPTCTNSSTCPECPTCPNCPTCPELPALSP